MANNPHLISLFVFGTLLIITCIFAVVVSVIIQKQRQVRHKLARQQLAFDYSQSLLNTRIEVRETTLNMLAQELHDNVVQSLTGCFLQVASAAEYMVHERGRDMIEEAKASLKGSLSDVRLLSHSLATGLAEQRDLQVAVQAELNRIQAFSKIACTLTSNSIHELHPEQRLLLFRVVQEVLQNVLKHAQANSIRIAIEDSDQQYQLVIEDDGKGFITDSSGASDSLGLINIRHRIAMLKGALDIRSSPGKGTTITIEVPINHQNE